MAKSEKDVDLIFATIEKHVTLKRTGLLYPSHLGGGVVRFLGRVVSRRKGERSLLVSLPPDYLDGTFKDYGLVGNASKIATHPPDVAAFVEKEGGIPLTPDSDQLWVGLHGLHRHGRTCVHIYPY